MKNRNLFLSFSLLAGLLAAGCQNAEKAGTNEVDALRDSVMAVHDEVMPRMEEMMELRSRISSRIDSLSKLKPASSDLEGRQKDGVDANLALKEADSLMMSWMNHYKSDTFKVLDAGQAKAYLDHEMEKISVVREKMNTSIDQAKKYLQQK
ncbi:hypothetical protein [Larkinella soli]|uniref:hypothetical protein n=1 Tax=Larkinella soli TaxID=1770527 RepID=UPI000FFB17BF|nr:hypothetical protein [Larkinella soli]